MDRIHEGELSDRIKIKVHEEEYTAKTGPFSQHAVEFASYRFLEGLIEEISQDPSFFLPEEGKQQSERIYVNEAYFKKKYLITDSRKATGEGSDKSKIKEGIPDQRCEVIIERQVNKEKITIGLFRSIVRYSAVISVYLLSKDQYRAEPWAQRIRSHIAQIKRDDHQLRVAYRTYGFANLLPPIDNSSTEKKQKQQYL